MGSASGITNNKIKYEMDAWKKNFIKRSEIRNSWKDEKSPNSMKTSPWTHIKIYHTDICITLGGTTNARHKWLTLI